MVVKVGEVGHVAVLGPVGGASDAVAGGGQLERLHLKERHESIEVCIRGMPSGQKIMIFFIFWSVWHSAKR